jgi:Skp family chaperone for outer membrane proteins
MMTSTRMAYVDIERVFNDIQEVRNAKDSLIKLIEDKKREIEETERAIASVRNKIKNNEISGDVQPEEDQIEKQSSEESQNLEETATQQTQENLPGENQENQVPVETQNIQENRTQENAGTQEEVEKKGRIPDFEIKEFEKILAEKEKDLKKLMEDSKRLIKGKEKEFKYEILGKIYEAVQNIAVDKGYSVIVDKEVILFSEESVVDITDEVIRNLNEKSR